MPGQAPQPVHLVVPTHTTRYLELVLAGAAGQTARPDTIVVSCDTDDRAIGDLVAACCERWRLEAWWVRRAHHGEERLCQVRNNAARLLGELGATAGRLLVLDGDMVACRGAVWAHADMGADAELVLPYRVDLTEQQSASLDAAAIAAGKEVLGVSEEQAASLRHRDRRYRKHLAMRRLRLGPPHKPKLLGGHFSCSVELYDRLNGFDELYRGWGFKDDEFAYRAARVGARALPACEAIPAWHLHHTTRQPDRPMRELPTAQRFAQRRSLPLIAEHGVRNPLPQHPVAATLLGPEGGPLAERALDG